MTLLNLMTRKRSEILAINLQMLKAHGRRFLWTNELPTNPTRKNIYVQRYFKYFKSFIIHILIYSGYELRLAHGIQTQNWNTNS